MAKFEDKEDDGRDIWEKIVPIAAGTVGAVAGNKLGRRLSKKHYSRTREEHDNVFNGMDRDDRFSPERWISPEERNRVKGLYTRAKDVMSASGMIGGASGGAVGAATGGAITAKRRK